MKKIIYLFVAMGAYLFTACNPMDDIYTEIDAQQDVITGDAVYTLTDDDYATLDVNGGFTSVLQAKVLIPDFLSNLYPVWGNGSTVLVGYKMEDGKSNLKEVSDYYNAGSYQLKNTDYPGYSQNAFAFFPNEDPADYLGDLLSYLNPVEGQIVLVKYNKYVSEPVTGIVNYFEANFNGGLENFEPINVIGSQSWYDSSFGGVEFAKMSGYSSGAQPNEDWLISPEIDLTNQTNLTFEINQAINYAGGQLDLLNILVSTDYTTGGDQSAATWTPIALATAPAGTNWSFVQSEAYDLSAYEGQKIHLAFKYESTSSVAATWEIDNVIIKTPGVEGATSYEQVYYVYKGGAWVKADGVYHLSAEDYDSMGTASGQPGQYNNFSGSVDPNNYIPALLNLKFPFAQEEDELIVTYKYYNSGTKTRGNLYTVTNGVWVGNSPKLQFGHDGKNWVPDNTIKYTLTTADYDSLGEEYGSPGYYNNFDVREGKNDADESVRLQYINTILLNNFPGMSEGQKFAVSYDVYTGTAEVWTMYVILKNGVYVLQ